jgi:hydrogenase maturation protease
MKTLVLGIGNALLCDEAVGVLVVRRLAQESAGQEDIHCIDGGTLSFTLSDPIGMAQQLIVVDAARMGCPPGTISVFEGAAMDQRLRHHAKSVHETSLSDLLDIARLTDSLPPRRALIGIEPAKIEWGLELTPAVASAIPKAIAEIRALLSLWQDQP